MGRAIGAGERTEEEIAGVEQLIWGCILTVRAAQFPPSQSVITGVCACYT